MCWFSSTLLNTCDVKDVGGITWPLLSETSANACGLGTIQSNMPSCPLEIKGKSYLTDAPPSDMATKSVNLYQPKMLHQYNIHIVQRVVMSLQLQHICLLANVTFINIAAVQTCLLSDGPVLLYLLYLLVWCLTISRVCWYGVSLSAVSAGMVSHYQPCLLVWCFIIDHAFWFGISLSAMPVGVVPHYRSCHLVWCLTVGHFFWCGASLQAMPVGVVPHYRSCLLVRFAL